MKKRAIWSVISVVVLGMALTQGMWNQQGWQRWQQNRMQGYGMGSGMMGIYPAQAQPVSETEAKTRLEAYAKRYTPEGKIKEIMAFSQNYYAQIVDAKGNGLGEILLDRYTANVYPEPGPNMMWNTRGGMGFAPMANQGMMRGQSTQAIRFDQAAAQKVADQFLKGYLPGAKVLEGQAFAGYYTFDFGRKELEGMLSVSAHTGEIWMHSWHGVFLGE